MNKKGFTLAELLGVIVLLSIISIIAITTVDVKLKEGRIKTCKAQEKNIFEGAKTWLIDNPNDLNESKNVTIQALKDGGYLEEDLKNPMTDENYKDGTTVVITKNGEKYEYEISYASGDTPCVKNKEE